MKEEFRCTLKYMFSPPCIQLQQALDVVNGASKNVTAFYREAIKKKHSKVCCTHEQCSPQAISSEGLPCAFHFWCVNTNKINGRKFHPPHPLNFELFLGRILRSQLYMYSSMLLPVMTRWRDWPLTFDIFMSLVSWGTTWGICLRKLWLYVQWWAWKDPLQYKFVRVVEARNKADSAFSTP